jgi:hypothetical protein
MKRLGGGLVELLLGAFIIAVVIAAMNAKTAEASVAKAPPAPAALVQQVLGTICIQDDSNQNFLSFDSATGAYTFTSCLGGVTLTGTGTVKIKGCTVTLEHITTDRRVTASADLCVQKGKASAQVLNPQRVFTIADRNTSNNTCACQVVGDGNESSRKKRK